MFRLALLLMAGALCAWGLRLVAETHARQPDYRIEQLTVADGLAASGVGAIAQDTLGFIWMGTGAGLHRYDGYRFTVYQHDPRDPGSLSSNEVGALLVTRSGTLWVATANGLDRFDPETESFTHFHPDAAPSDDRGEGLIESLFEDDQGSIWTSGAAGLQWFDPKSGRFTRVPLVGDDDPTLRHAGAIRQDRDGFLWVASWGGGLVRLDPATGASSRYRHDPADSYGLGDDGAINLLVDRNGRLWVTTWQNVLHRFDPDTGTFTRFQPDLPGPPYRNIALGQALVEDRTGSFWIGNYVTPSPFGEDGLLRFDPERGTFIRFPHVGNRVLALYEDRSGILWVGTEAQGIFKLDLPAPRFTSPLDPSGSGQDLSNPIAWAVHEGRDGTVWVGTEAGLNRLDPATGRITRYQHDPHDRNSLIHDLVKAVLEDRSGILWIGTYGDRGGLNRLDPATGRVTRYQHDPDDPSSLSSNIVETVYEDQEGTLWVGTFRGGFFRGGLDRFDPATETFVPYRRGLADSLAVEVDDVRVLYADREGTLWVGGAHHAQFDGSYALYRLDRRTATLVRRARLPFPTGIAEDYRGRLWVTTSGGLFLVDKTTGQTTRYGRKEGLPQDQLEGLVPDHAGNLWVSTHDMGLFRFNPDDGRVTAYDVADGLPTLQFLPGAAFAGASGSLLFGSTNGIVSFRPDRFQDDPYVPPVVLTGFRLFNEPVPIGPASPLKTSITVTRALTLTHAQNDLTFEFAALGYRRTEQNRYAYRLEGYDRSWREAGTQRTATYTNLPPAGYVFRVRGSNADGVWNTTGAAVRLTIRPPWWQTWWCRLLFAAAVLAVGAAAYRFRVSHLLRIERERRRIADDLHDDIGAKLSGIAMLVELAGRSPDVPAAEQHLLVEATRSARQLVDDVRDTIWLIDTGHNTLADLVERIGQVTVQLLRGMPHTVQLPDTVPDAALRIEARRNVLFVVKEALHNALRHADASRVDVAVVLQQDTLVVMIRDEGKGFAKNDVEPGRGLQTMHARAHGLGGTLTVDSTPSQGTTVRLAVRVLRTVH